MSIAKQYTDDTCDQSGEYAVHKGTSSDDQPMASRRQRVLLAVGILGAIALLAIVATVSLLVVKSFSRSETDQSFDFSEIDSQAGSDNAGPTLAPTEVPTESPSLAPQTDAPTSTPSEDASELPSIIPSLLPSGLPSVIPSIEPSATLSEEPSDSPMFPSAEPSRIPTTMYPTKTLNETSSTLMTFCVIADVPYTQNERVKLPGQIQNQMEGCEFLVHLGDLFQGEVGCDEERYILVKDMMMLSKVPAFIVPGDNEWNDCGNRAAIDAAWGTWSEHFMNLEDNWNHTFSVARNLDYQENFYFIHKRTLVFGLNIVGGRVHDRDEWFLRLSLAADWVKAIVEMNVPLYADGVIIMAHAKPTDDHVHFFQPLRDFIKGDLQNEVPFLYLHGDGHDFIYTHNFLNRPNLVRIQHEGGVRDPVLKILADPAAHGPLAHDSFQFDRQLELE